MEGGWGGGGGGLNDTVWSDVWRGQWKNKMVCQEESNNVQRTANGSEEYEVFRMLCLHSLLLVMMVWGIFLFYGYWVQWFSMCQLNPF